MEQGWRMSVIRLGTMIIPCRLLSTNSQVSSALHNLLIVLSGDGDSEQELGSSGHFGSCAWRSSAGRMCSHFKVLKTQNLI